MQGRGCCHVHAIVFDPNLFYNPRLDMRIRYQPNFLWQVGVIPWLVVERTKGMLWEAVQLYVSGTEFRQRSP